MEKSLRGWTQSRTVSRASTVDFILGIFLLISGALWCGLMYKHWRVVLEFDDAHMFYRYAEHIRSGLGISWNPDGVHTYGPTSLLWVAVVFFFSFLPLNDSHALLLASWLAGAGALVLIAWAISVHVQSVYLAGLWRPLGLFSPPVVALYGFHSNAVNGMETMASVAINALIAGCLLKWNRRPGAWTTVALAFAGLAGFLCRPDSGLPFTILVFLGGMLLLRESRLKWTAFALVLYFALVVSELAVCKAYFGTVLPFSFYVKSTHGYEGYTKLWYPANSLLVFLQVAAVFLGCLIVLTNRRTWRIVLVFALPVFIASVYYTGFVLQIMGHFARYYIPLLPFVVVPAVLVLDDSIVHKRYPKARSLITRIAVFSVLCGSSPALASALDRHLGSGRYAYELPVRKIAASRALPQTNWFETQVELADRIMRALPAGASIAATEVGYLGSELPADRVVDLSGLNDPHTLRREPMSKVVFEERPDLIWLPVPDYSYMYGSIYSDPVLMRDYVVYDGAFNYGLAVRKDSQFRERIESALKDAGASLYPGYNLADYVVQSVTWDRRRYALPKE